MTTRLSVTHELIGLDYPEATIFIDKLTNGWTMSRPEIANKFVARYNAGQEAIEAWDQYQLDQDFGKLQRALNSASAANCNPF
jgi:hypothetical protein